MAEQLFAFKQQILESEDFSANNKKYEGWRHSSFSKSPAVLYFSEENIGDFKTDNEYFLIMEYGSGSAVKVSLRKIDEFYIVEGTSQICFKWPEKKLFKSKRSEVFESDSAEAIFQKYCELDQKLKEEGNEVHNEGDSTKS